MKVTMKYYYYKHLGGMFPKIEMTTEKIENRPHVEEISEQEYNSFVIRFRKGEFELSNCD